MIITIPVVIPITYNQGKHIAHYHKIIVVIHLNQTSALVMIKLWTFALLEKGSRKDAQISQSYSTHNFTQINGSFFAASKFVFTVLHAWVGIIDPAVSIPQFFFQFFQTQVQHLLKILYIFIFMFVVVCRGLVPDISPYLGLVLWNCDSPTIRFSEWEYRLLATRFAAYPGCRWAHLTPRSAFYVD